MSQEEIFRLALHDPKVRENLALLWVGNNRNVINSLDVLYADREEALMKLIAVHTQPLSEENVRLIDQVGQLQMAQQYDRNMGQRKHDQEMNVVKDQLKQVITHKDLLLVDLSVADERIRKLTEQIDGVTRELQEARVQLKSRESQLLDANSQLGLANEKLHQGVYAGRDSRRYRREAGVSKLPEDLDRMLDSVSDAAERNADERSAARIGQRSGNQGSERRGLAKVASSAPLHMGVDDLSGSYVARDKPKGNGFIPLGRPLPRFDEGVQARSAEFGNRLGGYSTPPLNRPYQSSGLPWQGDNGPKSGASAQAL